MWLCCWDSGSATIKTCTNNGDISGEYAGGICGHTAGNSGSATIDNCTNNGDISGDYVGGICGGSAGFSAGSVTIDNCNNIGTISGGKAGGICGYAAGYNGSASIEYCYNEGAVSGQNSGGICSYRAGYKGSLTIKYCYNKGTISEMSGGICGSQAGYDNGLLMISYCYNIGAISGNYAGGICGYSAAYTNGTVTIFNCYNNASGNSGTSQGGIVGNNAGDTSGMKVELYVYNCWSKGDNLSKGIVAHIYNDANTIVAVRNCYHIGLYITAATNTSNNLSSTSWDDTYAYYTIGQNNITGYTDIRWNNDNVTEWLISVESGGTLMGSFAGSYVLGSANQGDIPALSDLLVLFRSSITESGGTYTLGRNITIDDNNKDYFPIPIEDGVTFDGNSKTIDINVSGWTGLFTLISTTSDITFNLKNTTIKVSGGSFTTGNSWFFKDNNTDKYESNNIDINNCHVTTSASDSVLDKQGGAIVGQFFGYGATCSIYGCSNSLKINGDYAGGITGGQIGSGGGNVTIEYCWNIGELVGNGAGGICGLRAGEGDGSKVVISYCYNNGPLTGQSAGGICGVYSGANGGTVTIFNCYNNANGKQL